jgi:UDP-glucuronate 4-epimerase
LTETCFITGTAGFIGFHLARRLLRDGYRVVGYDAISPFYDVSLKEARLRELVGNPRFVAVRGRLEDTSTLAAAARDARPDVIVHLAGQAGVRYSLENPQAFLDANVTGSWNVLEVARALKPRHLLLASSSSVYGGGPAPFVETAPADRPMSTYAATKRTMELMAHAAAHLHGVPTTALRFFTVYGPWGRPDMAVYRFVDAVENGRPIDVHGDGRSSRDYTYVDDTVEAVVRLIGLPPSEAGRVRGDSLSPVAPFRTVNIGGGMPVALNDLIAAVETAVGRRAIRNPLPEQPGDVPTTAADTALLQALTGLRPQTSIATGVGAFVDWYRAFRREPA